MTRQQNIGILIIATSVALVLVIGAKLRGQKTINELPVQTQDTVSTELPAIRLKPSRITSSTVPGWDVYTSEQLGIQIEIPSNWDRKEYTGFKSDDVVSVAFDPVKVVTQLEYETFDQSAGRVHIRRESPYAWASVMGLTRSRKIGPEQILVKYAESDPTVPASNPAWVGLASESYYSTSNTVPFSIEFVYPTIERKDAKKQQVFERILESVRSVPVRASVNQ